MTKSMLERIKDPNSRWIVYLYVIPHYQHEMYYVGVSSNDMDVRVHYWYGNNPELIDAIRKAGGMKNVKKYIIAKDVDASTAAALERKYISKYHSLYNPYDLDNCYGYNKQDGGFFGWHHCQFSKDKISQAKGKPVAQILLDENKIFRIYASQKIAEDETGIAWQNISKAVNGINNSAGGYRWTSLDPFMSPKLKDRIFYSKDDSDMTIPIDPKDIYSSIKSRPKKTNSKR